MKRLKKFFNIGAKERTVTNADLLSSNEALKLFANMWDKQKEDLMMMVTKIEYDFITNNEFDKEQLLHVKGALGDVLTFYARCNEEYYNYLKRQQKNKAQVDEEE
jgi:hypothetical protein